LARTLTPVTHFWICGSAHSTRFSLPPMKPLTCRLPVLHWKSNSIRWRFARSNVSAWPTKMLFAGSRKCPQAGPCCCSRRIALAMPQTGPSMAALPAHHGCTADGTALPSCSNRGLKASPCGTIDRGSPWVTPSFERRSSQEPPWRCRTSSEAWRWQLKEDRAPLAQRWRMVQSMSFWPSSLKPLRASTWRSPVGSSCVASGIRGCSPGISSLLFLS